MLDSSDEELREMAKMEIAELDEKLEQYENELKILLLPKDPNDDKNVILEIRAGTEERKLLSSELTFSECICAMPSAGAGKRKLWK